MLGHADRSKNMKDCSEYIFLYKLLDFSISLGP